MQALKQVIEAAAANAGSAAKLARMLQVRPQRLTEWKNGHRPCPLPSQARIAELAEIDAKTWVWEQLRRQLGRRTAAVLSSLAARLAASNARDVDGAPMTRRNYYPHKTDSPWIAL